MEEEVLITRPVFISKFRCTGAACPDNCCKGWNISLSKTIYHQYRDSEDPDIKKIAVENLEVLHKSDEEWARIKLNSEKICPFLAEDRLCSIHKKLGPDALSQGCKTYPHVLNFSSALEEQYSVKLSCPETVRLLLADADAMKLTDTTVKRTLGSQSMVVNQEARLINLFCTYLLLIEEQQAETSLYAMITFLLAVQKSLVAGSVEENLLLLTENYDSLIKQLLSGETERHLQAIKPNNAFQWEFLNWMQNFIRMQNMARGGIMKDNYLNPLNEMMTSGGHYLSETDRHDAIVHLRHAWSDKVRPWLAAHPHVLRNYLLYRCYHDNFPCHAKLSPLQMFYLLAVDVFFIKSLIAVKVVRTGTVDMNDFINVIYGYHTVRQHCKEFEDIMIAKIETIKINDDLSSLLLLL